MKTVLCLKYYGVKQKYNGRYQIITDVNIVHKRYKSLDLDYAKLPFALKKADAFMKHCYKPFVNFKNEKIEFDFNNLGLIDI